MRPTEVEAKEAEAVWHLEVAAEEAVGPMTTDRHFVTNKAVLRVLRDHEQDPGH